MKQTLLHEVCIANKIDFAAELLRKANEESITDKSQFLKFLNSIEWLDLRDNKNNTALVYAIKSCNEELILLLVRFGASLTRECEDDLTPLHHLIGPDLISLFESLVEKNPEHVNCKNKNGKSLLHHSLEINCNPISTFLLTRDNISPSIDITTLRVAISSSAPIEIIKKIISLSPNLITCDFKNGESLMHCSLEARNFDLVSFMLTFDSVNVSTLTRNGMTLLHNAIEFSAPRHIILQLINRGCDIHVPTPRGRTPLHCAAVHKHADAIVTLLQFGVSIHETDDQGNTPVHSLIVHDGAGLLSNFIALEVDYFKKNLDGHSIMHLLIIGDHGAAFNDVIKRALY